MKKDLFARLSSGESVPFTDPEYSKIHKAVDQTKKLSVKLNNADDSEEIRELLGQIIGNLIDKSATIFTPFYTDYEKNIRLGKNIFINHACSFLDLVGITIEDNVMIAHRVNLSSESHPISIKIRKTLIGGRIHIKKNAWIGANATILQGVTIGENSVIAAGSVVSKDVPDNCVAGGIAAKIINKIT